MKNRTTKILAIALAVVTLALAACIGTLAWLYDTKTIAAESFTVGEVYISVNDVSDATLHIVPGDTDELKPQVTVEAGSEPAYVFVKANESMGDLSVANGETFASYITYSFDATNWKEVPGEAGVYYTTVGGATDTLKVGEAIDILTDDSVTYVENVTNAQLKAVQDGGEAPSLGFTVYACQQLKDKDNLHTVELAWTIIEEAYTLNP